MTNDAVKMKDAPTELTLGGIFKSAGFISRLRGIAPPDYDAPRLMREAAAMLRSNPKLREFDPTSFGIGLVSVASLGFYLGPENHVYLIPRTNKRTNPWTVECQVMVSARGWEFLGMRAGAFTEIEAVVVFKADQFKIRFANGWQVEHEPALTSPGPIIAAYGRAVLPSGVSRFELLREDDIAAIRSKADKDSAAWRDFEGEMVRKAVIKRLCKRLCAGHALVQRAYELERDVDAAASAADLESSGVRPTIATEGKPLDVDGPVTVVTETHDFTALTDQSTGEVMQIPPMTFATVSEKIEQAATMDALDLACDLVRAVADDGQQKELQELARQRAEKLR